MNPINVVHIAEPTSGGVRTHILQLAEFVPANIHQLFIVSSLRNKAIEAELKNLDARCRVVNMKRGISPLDDIVALIKIYNILREVRPDIVHCHSSKSGLIGRIAARFAGVRYVFYTPHAFSFHIHQTWLHRQFYKLLERLASTLTSRLICVSPSEMKFATKVCSSDKLVVVPNGVHPPLSMRSYKPHGLLHIGFVGRLTKQKDPFTLIRALCELSEIDYKLTIVGDGELWTECNILVDELGLRNRVSFKGHLEDPMLELETFDLLVIPSLWEGFPYVLLEAMVIGVPIVGSDIPGITDLVIDGVTGRLFEPQSPRDAADKIKLAVQRWQCTVEMAIRAKQLVRTSYTIEQMIQKLVTEYQRIIECKEPSGGSKI